MITKSIAIKLPRGLEARPIAELVQHASRYDASLRIKAGNATVNAKSIMGMMALTLNTGDEVMVTADGSDEEAAIIDLEGYLSGTVTGANVNG
ncbi:MAG: HPr family phosphocarrier protein [Lachnospiraceae bacterium]|nr:HPr family phosphocarrier protein [Lachnospiraceae bacterium]